MKLNDIRKEFINFFEKKQHTVVQSSSLVPHNDPTLMFTNAGMNQFKDIFTGKENAPFARAVSVQKCVRAGGKHNDLDNVGYTSRHHTFFEMVGNFSFGDYFKEKAILYAYELLTKNLGIDESRLLATVYHTDDEAFNLWKKITGWNDDRIIKIATKDNFWEMGEVGPCGPCSEIFYDYGESVKGGKPGTPDQDGDRFVEIWNLVFMQMESLGKGKYVDLPSKNIDTGGGLERWASVLQGKTSNYDIDLFVNIKNFISDKIKVKITPDNVTAFNVIADHLRCMIFLIADGVLPSNEGRGYVLRRIMRRAMRYANMLGVKNPVLYKMTDVVIAEMGGAYKEIVLAKDTINAVIFKEEETFLKTLSVGLKILKEETADLKSGDKLSGETAFKLYDTYGFPVDMTQDALRRENIEVDMKGFEKNMDEQKERSKKSSKFCGDTLNEKIWFELETAGIKSEFVGYEKLEEDAKIIAIIKDGKSVKEAKINDEVFVVLDKTPFYGETGGQIGDVGFVGDNEVVDSIKPLKTIIASIVKVKTAVKVGDKSKAVVDREVRLSNVRAHSAAHLFQKALKEVIGNSASQRGSGVGHDVMRFDFSHQKGLSAEELQKIEVLVNSYILENAEICTLLLSKDEAIQKGALALFGEKYDDTVRVVEMGDLSLEFCGGTHARRTGDIGFFKIVSESSIASGIRRIEACTGLKALHLVQDNETKINNIAKAFKSGVSEIEDKVKASIENNKLLAKEVAELKTSLLSKEFDEKDLIEANGKKIFFKVLKTDANSAKGIARQYLSRFDGIVCVIIENDGKSGLIVANNIGLNSSDIIKKITGSGGGTETLAQSGLEENYNEDKILNMLKEQ
ncbi:MAG: alanine--tRNA ligase [Rickettsiales bacterium]|jgi:alanyl-tRNA synthetase|nr:alanine--tRNA ligase [Rickettsiales bacterium]